MIKNINIQDGHVKLNKYKEFQHLLPSKENIREFMSFEVHHPIATSYSNSLRRILLEELYVYHLDFELGAGNININDVGGINDADDYILDDMVRDRIIGLSINQIDDNLVNNIIPDKFKNLRFEIDVFNDTEEVIYVLAKDIKPYKHNYKLVFAENVPIIGLNPKCRLNIKNIFINKNSTVEDGKLFNVSNFTFLPLIDGSENSNKQFSTDLKSSVVNVEKYRLSFNTFGVSASVLLENSIKHLKNKLQIMYDVLHQTFNNSPKTENQYNISVDIISEYIFKYYNINFTLSTLIVHYINFKFPDFPFCNYELVHPAKNEMNLIIKHKDSVNILLDSIKQLIQLIDK